MELPKINAGAANGVLDNIKSRLGLSSNEDKNGYDEGYDEYDDGYGDYDDDFEDGFDFGEEGFDEAEYGGSYESSNYEPYAPVTTRSTSRSYSSTPRLVTIGDVKANASERQSYGSARGTDTRDRVVIDSRTPASASPVSSQLQTEGRFTSTLSTSRNLSVLRPMAYNDVERVARIVRSGDVAVLSLRATPDNLFNRVLDFSFGVASALDARVDCVGNKVFAICTGASLSESEKASLKGQGII